MYKNLTYNPKIYSFRKRIILLFSSIISVFLLVFAWMIIYFAQTIREETYGSVSDTLEVYNQQLTHNLDKLHIFMYDMSEYSLDMIEVFSAKDLDNIYNHIIRSKELLDYSVPSFTEIDGMFLYSPINDTFIQSYKYTDGVNVSNYIRSQFRTAGYGKTVNTNDWYFEIVKEEYYLVRTIIVHDSFIGSWTKVSRLTSTFDSINELNGNILYVDREGNVLSSNNFANLDIPIDLPLDTYHIIGTPFGKALLVMNDLDYCDYYLAALIPLKNIDKHSKPVLQLLVFLSLALLIFFVGFTYSVTRFLSKPIHILEDAATRMREGNFDQKLPEDMSNCQEIIDIDTAYNRMIDEIQHLRIDIYEEKIAKSNIELQYLKSQMAPHFLINCLFSIMAFTDRDGNNRNILHKMIGTLSEHLRYTLSNRTTVPLSKELSYVENYIELTKLRFPEYLSFITEIEPEAKFASVFPLILLMLTENSIKYNMVMGEELIIKISARLADTSIGKTLHLTHIDSGDGFSEKKIAELKRISKELNSNLLKFSDVSHIGIPNVAKRLKIVYGESATIHFSNEPGYGARIDLKIPYIKYCEDNLK